MAAALVIAITIGVFLLLSRLSRPDEATAQFIPSSAPGYVSINLRPGVDQLNLAKEVTSLLQTDDFLEKRDDILDEVEDETDIHFLDDVKPWLGTDITLALLDVDPDAPEWVLLAQISDRYSALDFVDDLVSYLEDGFSIEFESDDRRGTELWVSGGWGYRAGGHGRVPAHRG